MKHSKVRIKYFAMINCTRVNVVNCPPIAMMFDEAVIAETLLCIKRKREPVMFELDMANGEKFVNLLRRYDKRVLLPVKIYAELKGYRAIKVAVITVKIPVDEKKDPDKIDQ